VLGFLEFLILIGQLLQSILRSAKIRIAKKFLMQVYFRLFSLSMMSRDEYL